MSILSLSPSTEVKVQRYHVESLLNGRSPAGMVKEDVLRGLTSEPKSLPPKYFYDARGSALFERITRLPEYYLTRVEQGLIEAHAKEIMARVSPREVIELGPGSMTKIRPLFNAQSAPDTLCRYIPFDVDEQMVRSAAKTLVKSYPSLYVHGVVGDFEQHLGHVPAPIGRRLVVFFGSTIGNLDPPARRDFLVQVRRLLVSEDRLLLGVDLVKASAILEAAYNDPGGVTVEFNRNILRVVNRAVHANFEPGSFQHYAYYNRQASRIEMHLVPTSAQTVRLKDLALSIRISPEESIWTESSYKFTRESTRAMLEEAGMRIERWYADTDDLFALVLVGPA